MNELSSLTEAENIKVNIVNDPYEHIILACVRRTDRTIR